jgi:hypothetical protein
MISLEAGHGRTEKIVELSMSCTVAEFNAMSASFIDPNGVPLIALTHLAVPSSAARLLLNGRDVGPVNEVCRPGRHLRSARCPIGPLRSARGPSNVLPEPGFREGLYIPSRTGHRHPEPVTRTVATNGFHEMLQRSGLEMPDPGAGYVSAMDCEALKIEGAEPHDRVEIRGVNVRGKAHGIEFWVYA